MDLSDKVLLKGPVQVMRIAFQALFGLDSRPAVTTVMGLDCHDRHDRHDQARS
jgi:hypothetical protein